MTNKQVIQAWVNRQQGQSENLRSDGTTLWSYFTVIAEHRPGLPSRIATNKFRTPAGKVSTTTSKQINLAAKAMPEAVREEF